MRLCVGFLWASRPLGGRPPPTRGVEWEKEKARPPVAQGLS